MHHHHHGHHCGSRWRGRLLCVVLAGILGGVIAALIGAALDGFGSPLVEKYNRYKQITNSYSPQEIERALKKKGLTRPQ
jgi:uncharacterized protein (DUF697 family)